MGDRLSYTVIEFGAGERLNVPYDDFSRIKEAMMNDFGGDFIEGKDMDGSLYVINKRHIQSIITSTPDTRAKWHEHAKLMNKEHFELQQGGSK